MNIGIDARIILYQRRGGAHYIYKLLEGLVKIDRENEYRLLFVFFRGVDKKLLNEFKKPNVKNKIFRIPNKILSLAWDKFNFPSIDLMLGKLDLFHIPYCHHFPPVSTKVIVTIHDLIPLRFPQYYSENELSGHKRILDAVSKRASLIITVSQNSKDDILKFMNVEEERVKVILLGVDERFCPINDKKEISQFLGKYGIDSDYILFVGGANPNKNLSCLVEAYRIFRENTGHKHKLVLIGKLSWGYEKIIQRVRELDLEEEVVFTGYIPDEELVYIYNGADLLVHPSLYEGFGFPPLEAMSCGVPVVASNVSSIPEVVGDAGILIDPYNTEDLAQAIIKVIDDSSLRQELIKKGLQRAKDFSWERCARETLAAYQQAVNS